jgi:hypothetical protein
VRADPSDENPAAVGDGDDDPSGSSSDAELQELVREAFGLDKSVIRAMPFLTEGWQKKGRKLRMQAILLRRAALQEMTKMTAEPRLKKGRASAPNEALQQKASTSTPLFSKLEEQWLAVMNRRWAAIHEYTKELEDRLAAVQAYNDDGLAGRQVQLELEGNVAQYRNWELTKELEQVRALLPPGVAAPAASKTEAEVREILAVTMMSDTVGPNVAA